MWQSRVREFLEQYNLDSDADWQETAALKTDMAEYRRKRPQEGLTRTLFDRIVIWKLRGQIHRTAGHLEHLNDKMIYEVTGAAIRLEHLDLEVSSRVRTQVLQGLPGVGLGVAAAILTMYFPESFGIIDFRCWDEIHESDPEFRSAETSFSISQYLTYLATIRPFAQASGLEVQMVDFALWKTWELRRARRAVRWSGNAWLARP